MYNENVKSAYLAGLNKADYQKVSYIFNNVEKIENERQLDIAEFDTAEYPSIIMKIHNDRIQRFSTFAADADAIAIYRSYCIKNCLVPEGVQPFHIDSRELYEYYLGNNPYKQIACLYEPDDVYYYLSEHLFADRLNKNEQFNGIITNSELIILYALLNYYVLLPEQISELKRSQVFINGKGPKSKAIILDENGTTVIRTCTGITAELLNKAKNAEIMQALHVHSKKETYLNQEYFFAFQNDNTFEERSLRLKKSFYTIFTRLSNEVIQNGDYIPTMSNISHKGKLYLICLEMHQAGKMFTRQDILNSYFNFSRATQLKSLTNNAAAAIEIVDEVRKRYKYLDDNNLWPE